MRRLAILVAAMLAVPALAQAPAPKLSSYKGDAVAGAKVFTACKACHAVEKGVNRIGPSLAGIVGRTSGSVPGFKYSAANKAGHIKWTPDTLFTYLLSPRKFLPGTTMAYAGLPDPQKRANLIAYLATLK
ncbi:MAG: c-type cytochrome [Polymorphobacter sp.]